MKTHKFIETPIGRLLLVVERGALTAVYHDLHVPPPIPSAVGVPFATVSAVSKVSGVNQLAGLGKGSGAMGALSDPDAAEVSGASHATDPARASKAPGAAVALDATTGGPRSSGASAGRYAPAGGSRDGGATASPNSGSAPIAADASGAQNALVSPSALSAPDASDGSLDPRNPARLSTAGGTGALREQMTAATLKADTATFNRASEQFRAYFAGSRRTFSLPVHPNGTDFQQKVWAAVLTIPYGETRSYKELAAQLGNPSMGRAIGAAIRVNPLAIIIPGHRVVRSTGGITGYSAGPEVKRFLLDLEAGDAIRPAA